MSSLSCNAGALNDSLIPTVSKQKTWAAEPTGYNFRDRLDGADLPTNLKSFFMAAIPPGLLRPLPASLLSFGLVGLTTWGLFHLQEWLSRLEGGHVHPYTIVFLLPIALLTVLGGRRAGFGTLALCVLTSAYVLTAPRFSLHIHHPSDWAEIVFLMTTGGLLVVGMEALRRNLEMFGQTQEAQARLQAVMDTSPIGLMTCGLDGRLDYANPEAERIWGHPFVPTDREGWRQYRLLEPDGTPTPPGRTTLGRVLAGEAASLSREMIVERPDGTRVWVDATSALVCGADGQSIGGLVVMADIGKRKRAEQEVADLLAQAQARADREALLNRIGQAIRGAPEPDTIQARVTAALGPALGADRCYFNFTEATRDFVRVGPDWHRSDLPSLAGEYSMSDYQLTWEALYPGGATLAGDAHRMGLPDASVAAFDRMGIRSVLSVPLLDETGFVGSLAVAMAEKSRDWTADEVALVETAATQTRAAIESARLRQREHAIASALQDALRPRLPERVPGLDLKDFYRPALAEANVGGDFYDVFPLDKGLFALVMGDVSGKGLAAAAQVATVRNMLRYSLYQHPVVAQAVTDLNQIVSGQELLSGFVTLFVGVYDTTTHEFTYASCGHEPGLVRRADGVAVVELPPTGPVLGASAQAVFDQGSLSLRPGDAFVLYTDGLSEAGRSRRDFWGVDGLTAQLRAEPQAESAADLAAHVIAGAVAHAQGVLHDDVCLLVGVVQANGDWSPSAQ